MRSTTYTHTHTYGKDLSLSLFLSADTLIFSFSFFINIERALCLRSTFVTLLRVFFSIRVSRANGIARYARAYMAECDA